MRFPEKFRYYSEFKKKLKTKNFKELPGKMIFWKNIYSPEMIDVYLGMRQTHISWQYEFQPASRSTAASSTTTS